MVVDGPMRRERLKKCLESVIVHLTPQVVASFARSSMRDLVGEKPIRDFGRFIPCFDEKKGLEIGGPSWVFLEKSILPVYGLARTVDNCNFSTVTVWEGAIKKGHPFRRLKDGLGQQFVCEGADLSFLLSESYDFVVSSHAIEHMANPLKALYEWKRVLKNHGVLLLCVPNKDKTFDHRRPTTSLGHMVEDFSEGVDEHDLSHLPEILELHDWLMEPGAGTRKESVERSKRNYENRCLHHHVFTLDSLVEIVRYVGFDILMAATHPPNHIVVFGQKNQ